MIDEEDAASKPPPVILKEEFKPAPEDANRPIGSERAFLKAREQNLDLESKIGKTQIVSVEAAAPGTLPSGAAQPGNWTICDIFPHYLLLGWYCEVCKCLLKDSTSYLDHINGKKRMLSLNIFLIS